MAHEIFISYSQPDRDCAFEMVARLESQGINCWIAPRDIAPSADWAAEIMDAISAARTMVLIFSAHSNHSPQVRREVERAVHKELNILPFRIEDVLPSKSLEFFLSTQHWMDAFPPPREPHYARLCAYLLKTQAAAEPPHPLSAACDCGDCGDRRSRQPPFRVPRAAAHRAAAGRLHWTAGEAPGESGGGAGCRRRGSRRPSRPRAGFRIGAARVHAALPGHQAADELVLPAGFHKNGDSIAGLLRK